jgi:GYF domain 2
MAGRSWFYASEGQQQGPYPEIQLRELISRRTITPDTLVWTEGMANWQKASDIPGLVPGGSGPPAVPQPGGPPPIGADGYGPGGGGSLSLNMGIWDFTWRTLAFLVGSIFIIPFPWLLVWYINWLTSCVQVPGRPNLSFTGSALTVAAWFFGLIAVAIVFGGLAYMTELDWLNHVVGLAYIALYWLFLRWFVENLASDGQPLGLSFSGSFWAFLGWAILGAISFITIIGWAWVYSAAMRWICRNIQGTRRAVVFNGSGWGYLWRIVLAALAASFIIPIPWMYRWLIRWQLSQTELVPRG